MDAVIYLEADEEITSVIDKLKRSKSPIVGIVAPRNAVLLQSIVNLKLLKKEADKFGKEVSLVTADVVGQNIALRTGLTVYKNIHDTEPITPVLSTKPQDTIEMDETSGVVEAATQATEPPLGFKVHHYKEGEGEEATEEIPNKEPNFRSKTIGELQNSTDSEAEKEADVAQVAGSIAESEVVVADEEPEEYAKVIDSKGEEVNEKPQIDKAELKRDKAVNVTGGYRRRWWHQKHIVAGMFAGALLAGVGIFMASTIYPKVTVRLTVATDSFSKSFTSTVSQDQSGVNTQDLIIPGKLLESTQEKTQKIKATGTKDVGIKATGTITVTNETGTDHSFESGTAFYAKDSNSIFRGDDSFTVPKATLDAEGNKVNGSIDIDVTANNPGDQYNIDATTYSITGYDKVYGSGVAMTGGETKVVTIVSKDDITKNKTTIAAGLYKLAETDLKTKSEGSILETKGIKGVISDSSATAKVGDEVLEFDLNVKTKSSALVYDSKDLVALAKSQLEGALTQGKQLISDSSEAKTTVSSSKPSSGRMVLKVAALGFIGTIVDENTIKQSLYGKNILEAEATLRTLGDVQSVKVSFNPSWWIKKIPKDAKRIEIKTHYEPKLGATTE